jgi:hypothetical protein
MEAEIDSTEKGFRVVTPRVKANQIIAQVRGYESENENSRDSTTTSGSLMP